MTPNLLRLFSKLISDRLYEVIGITSWPCARAYFRYAHGNDMGHAHPSNDVRIEPSSSSSRLIPSLMTKTKEKREP
ncbi:hypothetical protein QV65_32085 [Rhodococcus erythropolis]|nr:hypothetical protein QV65_32085 [Rhodococcus erythropolis]